MADDCTATRHGTRRAYVDHGCRCPEAVDAVNSRDRVRRPVGTRRGPRSRDQHPDLIAVDRAVTGDRTVYLTVLELGMAIAELRRRRFSAKATARLLGVSDRTVTRHRAGLVLNAAPSTVEALLSSPACGQPRDTVVHRLSTGSSTVALDSTDEQDAA